MGSSGSDSPVGTLSEIEWESDGIETELGWALAAMQQGYTRTATGAVANVPGGPRGYQVLVAITTEELSSQLALSHRLGIDKTQMTYVVDALAAAGLVERRPDPQDRRIRHVHPTDAGRTVVDAARAALRHAESVLMRHLNPEEQIMLRHLAARIALGVGELESATADAATARTYPVAAPGRSRRPHTATTPEPDTD